MTDRVHERRKKAGSAERVRAYLAGHGLAARCDVLPETLAVLVDDSLERYGTVYSAAGTPSSVVRLTLAELLQVSGGRVARISH